MKRTLSLTIVLVIVSLLWVIPSQAQNSSGWQAWLYNRSANELVRVNETGEVLQQTAAPALDGETLLGGAIAFSEAGNRAATCSEDENGNVTLIVYDLTNEEVLQTRELGNVAHCTLTGHSFDGRQLAYGVLNDIYENLEGWAFEVMDWQTGEILYSLNSEDAEVMVTDYLSVPAPAYHEGGLLVLRMDPFAIGGEMTHALPSFVWEPAENRLGRQVDDVYGNPGLDILSQRGEIIWLETDEDYTTPTNSALLPYTPMNVIKSSDRSGQHQVIVSGEGEAIGAITYADNGQKVLFQTIAYHTNRAPTYSWNVIDRNGNVTSLGELAPSVIDAAPTRDGFALLYQEGGQTLLARYSFVRNRLQEPEIIWTGEGDAFQWWLVWSTPITGEGNLVSWQNVAP
ncbi:MAG: hypothetical protein L0154_28140 [Chloroflexi bacterium]|nr:hypothetical protein [Chloroflexota bacterium]